MWISKKTLEELYHRITSLELEMATLKESQQIKCEDEATRLAIKAKEAYRDVSSSMGWVSPGLLYDYKCAILRAELNQPTINLREAVLKIADHLDLKFTTIPVDKKTSYTEKPILLSKKFNKGD